MAKCSDCNYPYVPNSSYICPNCGKDNSTKISEILGFILFIFLVIYFSNNCSNTNNQKKEDIKDLIEVKTQNTQNSDTEKLEFNEESNLEERNRKTHEIIFNTINNWNLAHNQADINILSDLYSEELYFYGENSLKKYKCIEMKYNQFVSYPNFSQEILEDINYEEIDGNIYKCNFTKRVKLEENSLNTEYPSYLILKINNLSVHILGESDEITDRNLGKSFPKQILIK